MYAPPLRGALVVAPDEPYDAVRASSIDGMGTEPHDHAILRALQADCTLPPLPGCPSPQHLPKACLLSGVGVEKTMRQRTPK